MDGNASREEEGHGALILKAIAAGGLGLAIFFSDPAGELPQSAAATG